MNAKISCLSCSNLFLFLKRIRSNVIQLLSHFLILHVSFKTRIARFWSSLHLHPCEAYQRASIVHNKLDKLLKWIQKYMYVFKHWTSERNSIFTGLVYVLHLNFHKKSEHAISIVALIFLFINFEPIRLINQCTSFQLFYTTPVLPSHHHWSYQNNEI